MPPATAGERIAFVALSSSLLIFTKQDLKNRTIFQSIKSSLSLSIKRMPHPFFPRDARIPNFAPQSIPMAQLLTIFFSAVGVILAVSWYLISSKPKVKFGTKLIFLWFISCGFIHSVVEGYFAFYHRTISTKSTLFADLWKEYSMSDSRYMSQDPFVAVMESMTAVRT
jgi:cholestenol Delta-isomerase